MNSPNRPLPAAVLAALNVEVRAHGAAATAARTGVSLTTLLRANAGLPVSPMTARALAASASNTTAAQAA